MPRLPSLLVALLLSCVGLGALADGVKLVALEPGYSLEIEKSKRVLTVRKGDTVARRFQIAVGRGGKGDKRIRGDNKTPLGVYHITEMKADGPFHLFMRLNYPNVKDGFFGLRNRLIDDRQFGNIVRAARQGETPPQDTRLGGAVGIHGLGEETAERLKIHHFLDWTQGCIALTNRDVTELSKYVEIGTKVTIRE